LKPMSVRPDRQADRPVVMRRGRGGGLFRWIVALVLLMVVVVGGGALYVNQQLQPVEGEQTARNVTIPAGSSVKEIGRLLEAAELIRNADMFSYYVKYKGVAPQLKAGEYQFTAGQTIDALLQDMTEGKTIVSAKRFTIPEGWNVEQIADHLDKEGMMDKAAFLKEVDEGAFPEYPFVAQISASKERKHRLEGYLFPETYEVEKDADAHDIVSKMLAQFQKEWKPQWTNELKERKLTVDQAVNLASIVEREVTVDKERPIVAGVYYNRMRDQWPLQADATVQFILGKQRDRLTFEDLKVDSPYNTYQNPGLPPGPIANPGRASLEAVVMPAKHDYFFYVTKKDGTSEHYFSRTLEEHNANNAKSRGN